MHAILFFALFQAAAGVGQPLRSGCGIDDPQIAFVSASDPMQVETAMAGDGATCYRVVLTRPGGAPINGYVLGESLPAMAAFVRRREAASEAAARAEAEIARTPERKAASEQAAPVDPLVSTKFEDFAGKDTAGKTVGLSGLKGKVTLVSFWSPAHRATIGQVTHVMPLYNRYHQHGLAVIGISMDRDVNRISETLDDITPPFSQIADRSGLAARYNVDPKTGKVFVLDANHRIVAAGPMGPDIDKAVRQALSIVDSK